MKTKIISRALYVILLVLIFLSIVSVADDVVYAMSAEEHYDCFDLYQRCLESFISSNIIGLDETAIAYNDNYAGTYIDDEGNIVIGVVNNQEISNVTHNIQSNAQIPEQIKYRVCNYSYNYLSEIMNALKIVMRKYDISMIAMNEENNCVDIDLCNIKSVSAIIEYLQDLTLYDEQSLNFNIDEKMEIYSDSDTAYGGESIFRYESTNTVSRGTICVNAIDNVTGQIGVLTNEHVAMASQQSDMYYGGHFSNNWFSTNKNIGVSAKGLMGGSIDAAFIPFDDVLPWGTTQNSRYNKDTFNNIKLGNDSHIIQGNEVMKIGQSSGVTYGKIKTRNASIYVDGVTIDNVFKYDNDSIGGDSGGPVYYKSGADLYLIGMHFATSESLGIKRGAACRMSNVMNTLDITPITNDTLITSQVDNGICVNSIEFDLRDRFSVPSTINEKTVVSIGNSAFANQTELKGVKVPYTVTDIGANAFENCTNMMYCEFETGSLLERIGNSAFYNSGLIAFTCPVRVGRIGTNTFGECSKLVGVNFEEGSVLTEIGNAAFYNCSLMLSVEFPEQIVTIGANAFENCDLSKGISFDRCMRLQTIGNSAFANTKAKNVYLFSISNIGYYAFYGCSEMLSAVIDNDVPNIDSGAFGGCEKLTIYTYYSGSTPAGWAGGWNSLNRPIVMGCSISGGMIECFVKNASNPFNANATNGINNPVCEGYEFSGWYTVSDFSDTRYDSIADAPDGMLYAKWTEEQQSCIASGTMITLADGTQKPVEQLTGEEMLLVWNLQTGRFDIAPILCIDADSLSAYEVINLSFSDGTVVKVISEHGFWDYNLNKYVYLDKNASQYIGHWFAKQTLDANGEMVLTRVQLTDVMLSAECTVAYSPVAYGHLCYYVNGMLSMPGGIEGLFNILTVDTQLMKYDNEALNADIEEYGLFSYEEFVNLCPVSKGLFDAVNGQYLKIAIGKGLLTLDDIQKMVEKYSRLFEN